MSLNPGDIVSLVNNYTILHGVLSAVGYVDSGVFARGIDIVSGERQLVQALVFGASSNCTGPGTSLPIGGDPPFPPVWPYTWDTSLIYGRDNLGMNQQMIRSNTYLFDITVTQNGVAVDLTGGTLTLTVRYPNNGGVAGGVVFICNSNTPDGITITNASAGQASVTVTAVKTQALPLRKVILVYDLNLLTSLGEIFTVLRGNWIVTPNVQTLP